MLCLGLNASCMLIYSSVVYFIHLISLVISNFLYWVHHLPRVSENLQSFDNVLCQFYFRIILPFMFDVRCLISIYCSWFGPNCSVVYHLLHIYAHHCPRLFVLPPQSSLVGYHGASGCYVSTKFLVVHRLLVLFMFLSFAHHRHQEIARVSWSSSLVRRFICSVCCLCSPVRKWVLSSWLMVKQWH